MLQEVQRQRPHPAPVRIGHNCHQDERSLTGSCAAHMRTSSILFKAWHISIVDIQNIGQLVKWTYGTAGSSSSVFIAAGDIYTPPKFHISVIVGLHRHWGYVPMASNHISINMQLISILAVYI